MRSRVANKGMTTKLQLAVNKVGSYSPDKLVQASNGGVKNVVSFRPEGVSLQKKTNLNPIDRSDKPTSWGLFLLKVGSQHIGM